MSRILQYIKRAAESAFGCRIYRDSLPWGADLFWDLSRFRKLSEFKVVFDVGSHVGQSIRSYLTHFRNANVTGFEPSGELFVKLQSVFANEARVNLHKIAASDKSGIATLYLKPFSSTHSIVISDNSIGSEAVETARLDEFCERQRIPHIDFLKVDTEGNDAAVLEGARLLLERGAIDVVQVETSARRDVAVFSRFWSIDEIMCNSGYELFGIYEQQPCWTGRKSLLYFNAVYVRSELVNVLPPL